MKYGPVTFAPTGASAGQVVFRRMITSLFPRCAILSVFRLPPFCLPTVCLSVCVTSYVGGAGAPPVLCRRRRRATCLASAAPSRHLRRRRQRLVMIESRSLRQPEADFISQPRIGKNY